MTNAFNRREFTAGSAALATSLMFNCNSSTSAEERMLSEKRLVLLGINALARSPEMNYYADGHRGAAMISAHMMCVDNKFDDVASARIVELLNWNWANSKLWFRPGLCRPHADFRSVSGRVGEYGGR